VLGVLFERRQLGKGWRNSTWLWMTSCLHKNQ